MRCVSTSPSIVSRRGSASSKTSGIEIVADFEGRAKLSLQDGNTIKGALVLFSQRLLAMDTYGSPTYPRMTTTRFPF